MENWARRNILRYFFRFRKENIEYKLNTDSIFGIHDTTIKIALIIAFIIGCLATAPIVLFDIYYIQSLEEYFHINTLEIVLYYVVTIGVFIFIEFYFLFKIGFFIVAKLIYTLHNLKHTNQLDIDIKDREFIDSLVRVSLEKPEPKRIKFNLDPYKYKSKNYILMSIIYKLKVTLTNFVAKLILKRVLSRSALRGFVSLIAIPITGFLNAYVVKRKIDEVKMSLVSRVVIYKLLNNLKNKKLSDDEKALILQVTAYRYLLYSEYNQNIDTLLSMIIDMLSIDNYNDVIKESKLLELNSSDKIVDNNYIKEYTIAIFAMKYNSFTSFEKEFLDSLDIYKSTKESKSNLARGIITI
jgi:hypothetical protein